MSDTTYTIQELTEHTGVPRRTVHFYSQQGVLPPPSGAGLGARYGEEHLLRLKLVPLLRRQGLRLDNIRERFATLTLEEMRGLLGARPSPARPPISPRPVPAEPSPQVLNLYRLPAGITILAPANLAPADRERLSALLDAAAQIFGPPLSQSNKGEHNE
jgi:DNA-binding transcriptional MerR regulator